MRWFCLWGSFASFRERLLPGPSSRVADVEMTSSSESTAVRRGIPAPEVNVTSGRAWDFLMSTVVLCALIIPTLVMTAVVLQEWITRPEQRGWLVLGFGFYIITALRSLWSILIRLCRRMLYIRVEVSRYAATTLFEALTDSLANEAEMQGLTCSWDQEALQEHDKLTGKIKVKLRFWSSQPRNMTIRLRVPKAHGDIELQDTEVERLDLEVQFIPGDDVVCGRDSRLERREVLVLSVRSNPERALSDKEMLVRWMEHAYVHYVKPIEDVVNVYSLQESSSDWVPEWKFERVKPCKNASATGQGFYLERHALYNILADAKLWSQTALRVYMITGPPGVGKSEFTIWIAGQLGIPVYRLCLSSPRLSDDRLAQLFSQSAISFNSILVQVDEFQETLQGWLKSDEKRHSGVSAGGFCEMLQGSTSMSRGVVIITGTSEIVADCVKRRLPAVFRRIHSTAELGWMNPEDIGQYFRRFLCGFIPSCTAEEWESWQRTFLEVESWSGSRHVSIDMLQQYLMHQITECSCLGYGRFVVNDSKFIFRVNDEHIQQDMAIWIRHGTPEEPRLLSSQGATPKMQRSSWTTIHLLHLFKKVCCLKHRQPID
ncbi:unnamed protein product [Durusdinium trenchii]|uniref:ATPase AAA-type core domain-containing protein n=1 Tax=Durusdinium trenchii TaxID=1381693 RepID=A0ABP0Q4M3_9DINO